MVDFNISKTNGLEIRAALYRMVYELSYLADITAEDTNNCEGNNELYKTYSLAVSHLFTLNHMLNDQFDAITRRLSGNDAEESENDEVDKGTESDAGLVDWTA